MSALTLMQEYAKKEGYSFFDIGLPCIHGHKSPRRVSNGQCDDCCRADERNRYARNRSRILAESKTPEFRKAASIRRKAFYEKNTELQRQRRRDYVARNPEKIREIQKRSDAKHRERKNAKTREWHQKNPERVRINRNERRARQKNAPGTHTAADIRWLHSVQRGLCIVCRCKLDKSYHVDHILPLVKGGSNDRKNLQLLCGACNHSKHAKHPIDFMQSRGFLL